MAGEQDAKTCETHAGQAITGTCAGCGKPVCRECAKQFGYYCSTTCLEKGRRTITEQVRERARKNEAQLRLGRLVGKLLLWSIPVLVLLGALAVAWRFWLDPAGKLCWQWQGLQQAGQPLIIGADGNGVTVVAGGTVVVLDPARGTEIRSFVLPGQGPAGSGAATAESDEDEDSGYTRFGVPGQFRVLKDGSLLRQKSNGICRVTTAGQAAFERTYEEGSISHVVLSPDETRAAFVLTVPVDTEAAKKARAALQQAEAELDKATEGVGWSDTEGGVANDKVKALFKRIQAAHAVLGQTRASIVCLDLATGKDAWASPKMKKGVGVHALAVGAQAVYAVFTTVAGDDEDAPAANWSLFALNAADGSRHGQAVLAGPVAWGPEVCGDLVLVQAGEGLTALKADGSEAWTLKLPDDAGLRPFWRDGCLLLLGEAGCRCLDPASGQEKWGVALELGERDVVVGGKRVYLAGEIEETLADKDMKLPPAYKELDKMPELKGIMEQARKKIVPMVVAVDRETGQELWRMRNAYGQPLGDDSRFILVADTAQTSLLEAATGGKGITIVRQINPRNGKPIYTRQSPLGFAEPRLIGKRIVGLAYERTERPSVFNPGAGIGMDSEGPKPLGLAAYRVK